MSVEKLTLGVFPVSIAFLPVCEVGISSLNSELSDSDHLASPPAVGDAIFTFLLGSQLGFLAYPAFAGVMRTCLGQALSDEPSPHFLTSHYFHLC